MGRTIKASLALAAMAAVWAPLGCGTQAPPRLTSDAFMPKPPPMSEVAKSDSGLAPVPVVVEDPPKKATVLDAPASAVSPEVHPIDPAAPEATLASSTTQPTAPETTSPTTVPAVLQGGLYMTLGGVVAEVNGTPIYANQVVTKLDKLLAAKAREMDPETFRAFARGELRRQRDELISSEAEYAAAQRLLTADDKKIIEQMAMPRFYQQKVTEAGGSVEQAKRKARAEGESFDDIMDQEHRKMMQELFYQRRIMPRIQVSAEDMRQFYRANLEKTYTERAQAQFRIIKIDPKRIGGEDSKAAALKRIKVIREQALSGADFAALASSENQDDFLRAHAGDPGGWMQRDCYRIDAIDKAVWKLQPGQITDVIEDDGAFYIARLEARKDGHVQPFDDQTVQAKIYAELWQRQFSLLRDEVRMDLVKEAVIRSDESLLEVAVDMAMQKYPRWASR